MHALLRPIELRQVLTFTLFCVARQADQLAHDLKSMGMDARVSIDTKGVRDTPWSTLCAHVPLDDLSQHMCGGHTSLDGAGVVDYLWKSKQEGNLAHSPGSGFSATWASAEVRRLRYA